MSEWWTYRLSDFLLFAPRTYYRLFELYNAELWPAQFGALALGAVLLVAALRGGPRAARVAMLLLAACWLWVAWAFHWQRYAAINWAAIWYAAAFAVQAVALIVVVGFGPRLTLRRGPGRATGGGLWLLALSYPVLGVLLGRPWQQAELFGLAPDPTVLASLGLLVLLRPDDSRGRAAMPAALLLLWPIPLAWCLVSGATLWAMHAPEALLLPAAALLALVATRGAGRVRAAAWP
jgi:hypothetical protein